jgi:hypothetical protein
LGSFPVPTPSGLPYLDIASGEKVRLAGTVQLDWLRIQPGGIVELASRTLVIALGNVEIAGTLRTVRGENAIQGQDFTLVADGVIFVTGTIDCSGWWTDERSSVDPNLYPGGDGGDLYIQSNAVAATPGIYVGPGAKIVSDGGPTFAQLGPAARPGSGGQILIGGFSPIMVAGRISAHGGRSYYTSPGFEGNGGQIEIISTVDVEFYNVREINGEGGASSGALAGRGGDIRFSAIAGTVSLNGFDIVANGGLATYYSSAAGGEGGVVTVKAQTAELSNMAIGASGGSAIERKIGTAEVEFTGGVGGDGGKIQVGASTLRIGEDPAGLVFLLPVTMVAAGGYTVTEGLFGGDGGNVVLDNQSGNPASFGFDGQTRVRAGRAPFGLLGDEGQVCFTGATLDVAARLTGSNAFPPTVCSASDRADLTASLVLSCDEDTGAEANIDTEIPPIVGLQFFRVQITDAIRNGVPAEDVAPTPYVTVTTKGSLEGNLHLYVGPEAVFGSLNPNDYPAQDTSAGDTKTVCVDVSSLAYATDEYLSVVVVEQNTFVEEFSISVGCSSAPCQ